MIPHPMLSNEIFGDNLKERVTACRKRLRLSRIYRGQANGQLEELFETTIATSELRGRLEAKLQARSAVPVEDDETAQRIDKQEVGIT